MLPSLPGCYLKYKSRALINEARSHLSIRESEFAVRFHNYASSIWKSSYNTTTSTTTTTTTAATCKPQRAGFAEIYKYLPSHEPEHRSRHTFLRPDWDLVFTPSFLSRPTPPKARSRRRRRGADFCVIENANN